MSDRYTFRLFGDTWVLETERETLVVRNAGRAVTPYEYEQFWNLASDVYAFRRVGDRMVDILFPSGKVFQGAFYAHNLGPFGPDNDKYLIAALVRGGTRILDEAGRLMAFIPGYARITILYDELLVVYITDGEWPYVKIYTFGGDLLAEGPIWEAIFAARGKLGW